MSKMKTPNEQKKESMLSMESAKKVRELLKIRGVTDTTMQELGVVMLMSEEIYHG